jgi:hypothetical protein
LPTEITQSGCKGRKLSLICRTKHNLMLFFICALTHKVKKCIFDLFYATVARLLFVSNFNRMERLYNKQVGIKQLPAKNYEIS